MKKLAFIQRNNQRHWVGDGFPVRSVFSYNDRATELSPFLLLDYAGPANFEPTTRRRGVGEHPHRGFETVTIVYAGEVEHRDSTGAGGIIGPGDVQWMTAGGGIVHQEYHSPAYARRGGPFEVIQLWVNLPAKDKMTAPGYQGITAAQIPVVSLPDNAGTVRVIAGNHAGSGGPARTFTPMNVWDVTIRSGGQASFSFEPGDTLALFILSGQLDVSNGNVVNEAELAAYDREGSEIIIQAGRDTRLLLLNGQPIAEPIVGHGPFVMNTREEIQQAMLDYQSGTMGRIPAG